MSMSKVFCHENTEQEAITKSLLQELRHTVDGLFDRFNIAQFNEIVSLVRTSPGACFFTGVGKSGIIAKKIAATMSACGMKAFFFSAQDALHGDIGMVDEGAIIFLLSKSGETGELLELGPALKNKGAFLVGVTMNETSRLAKMCDSLFLLPSLRELCPYDLAPTTSTLAQLVFGDLLAMTLMRLKKVSLHDFVQNHPSGRIGKRQILRVKDLMLQGKDLPLCSEGALLSDILVELSDKRSGCICVLNAQKELSGIFTDGDLRRSLQRFGVSSLQMSIVDLMTKKPRTVGADVLAFDAMRLMEEKSPVTVLPVLDQGRCVGLLRMHDILQAGL